MRAQIQFAIAFGLMIGFVSPNKATAQNVCNGYINPHFDVNHANVICLVGTNANGVPDPHGAFTRRVIDDGGSPVPNIDVKLDFHLCKDITLCQTQEAGTTIDCTGKTVTRNTDTNGNVTFTIIGKVNGGPPHDFTWLARTYICNHVHENIGAAAYDDGSNGVNGVDISRVYGDQIHYPNATRSDLNGDGVVNALDTSIEYGIQTGGGSSQSCGTFCP